MAVALMSLGSAANAQNHTSVRGYSRSDGTYIQRHMRTLPNATRNDNWSTIGNTNPYTGRAGTKPRGYSSRSLYRPYRSRR